MQTTKTPLGGILAADWMPKDEIWLVSPNQVLKLKNLAVPELPARKIGDWPWDARKDD